MATPKDFQEKTANRIADRLINGGSRVLLADEVGLGKTIVARRVIDLIRDWRAEVKDNFYRVVYICSNANISKQNIYELSVENSSDFGDSRLSMQHLQIAKREFDISNKAQKKGVMPERLIPLTPCTSFQIVNSTGTARERALMCALLPKITHIEDEAALSDFLSMNVKSWEKYINSFKQDIESINESNYISNMQKAFAEKSHEIKLTDRLNAACLKRDKAEQKLVLTMLRRIFAEISMDMLDPDLIVMDEFQRFSDLLHPGDDEQSMLVKRFFSNPETKILLLSATPYKPFSTLAEINEGDIDAYRDFLKVIDFLFVTKDDAAQFQTIWKRFSDDLRLISMENQDSVLESKNAAENELYKVMCRTERITNNMDPSAQTMFDIPIADSDILSFAEAQHLLDTIASHTRNVNFKRIPLDYVMSSPYLLSFMDKYQLKKYMMTHDKYVREAISRRNTSLCLNEQRINNYEAIPPNNGKLQFLHDAVFGELNAKNEPKNHIHQLLWVPASRPYYRAGGIFEEESSKSFSKFLIFSSWEMVPRMIAIMMSYYAERYTLGAYRKQRGGFSYRTSQKSKTKRVFEKKVESSFLNYPCKKLSELYAPLQHIDKTIQDIRQELRPLVKRALGKVGVVSFDANMRNSADQVLEIMLRLDGQQIDIPLSIHPNTLNILVDCAIASPAICAYRIEQDVQSATQVGNKMISLFNKPESAAIVDTICTEDRYYQQVLSYCVLGNLQAVLDEYKFTIKGDSLGNAMNIAASNNLQIDSKGSLMEGKRLKNSNSSSTGFSMRTHFASQYVDKVATDGSTLRTKTMQDVFNSPFRPFILATTSVGQEGLNFHWYARKLVHWNLPSNPIDMEQREGRINRYACHAIRRSIAHLCADVATLRETSNDQVWHTLFEKARIAFGDGYSQMVPYWCIPPECLTDEEKNAVEYVERLVPMFPYSSEHAKYKHLLEVLSLYRLTMGQPRQEELLELLKDKFNLEDMSKLLIDLSPYNKSKK